MDEYELGHTPCNWEQSERLLARTFESWRAEFRTILEDHRREIQARLEKIEREIKQALEEEAAKELANGPFIQSVEL